jgi:proteic killer suppression protein
MRRSMIKTFANPETESFFKTGKSRVWQKEIVKRAAMRLSQLNAAIKVEDLRLPPSNHLETLTGDRQGRWSIRINQRWRICFRFDAGNAFDVEIIDYH